MNQGSASERVRWIERLRLVSAPVLGSTPIMQGASDEAKAAFIDSFSDEAGHRRHIDAPLLSWMLGVNRRALILNRTPPPDEETWWRLAAGEAWVPPAWLHKRGALTSEGVRAPIEAWTQTELSVLDGLWRIAHRDGNGLLTERCLEASAWFIAEVQPDNATGHPWGIGVFLERWLRLGDVDARMYAEVQLNNCMVNRGVPDRFSACILVAGARSLEDPGNG